MTPDEFQELIWQKGRELYRDMPWRRDTRPYYILVSEVMLQQTQVDRVVPKFEAFIIRFPDIESLARAPLNEILRLWNGLGYNRRAKFLKDAASKIVAEYNGVFPHTKEELMRLPGIGAGTSGALMAYAFNLPVVFIETNIRTVYFHHFFVDEGQVSDSQLLPLVEATLDKGYPRDFYWALMDYGTLLKRHGAGKIHQSKHYKKQSPLKGSVREMRGRITRLLAATDMTRAQLKRSADGDERFLPALQSLIKDGLVTETNRRLHLTK